jgi:hypothetical protein
VKLNAIVFPLLVLIGTGCSLLSGHPRVSATATDRVVIHYEENLQGSEWRPVIEVLIDGHRGKFLVDSGAGVPVLTMEAVRECKLPLSGKTHRLGFVGNDKPGLVNQVDGSVVLEIGAGVSITWTNPYVVSGVGSDDWFGLLDYKTLRAAGAIIDTKQRTVTFSP